MFNFKMDKWFTNRVSEDFFEMCVGDYIGGGVYRNVYEYHPDPSLVIKIETDASSFANIRESQMWWTYYDHPRLSKWFAPCVQLSPRGQFLLQKKVKPLDGRNMPKLVPAMIDDGHIGNWGIYEDRVVCCDYGNHRSHDLAANVNLIKPKWSN
jgi:hypothetical protein